MVRVLIATRNRGKILELRALMGEAFEKNVEVLTLQDLPNVAEPREDGATFSENARAKALYYAKELKILCVADDSGLAVEALGGKPGVLSARYAGLDATDATNNALLLDDLKPYPRPWTAEFVCAAAAALPGRVIAETTGRVAGEIVPESTGEGGFGYDPVFLVAALGRTMAELATFEKNKISHRGQALRLLIEELQKSGVLG